jgi:antirestriction protein ArdC
VGATGAAIHHGGTMACYNLATDQLRVPPFESFRDVVTG